MSLKEKIETRTGLKVEIIYHENEIQNYITYNLLSPTGIKVGWIEQDSYQTITASCANLKKVLSN